ncbi:unnamed protein product [Pleuronectes platessa]|uniref:Uncharacterized protein n=1 Tax=Pleuronectes platessa TaxID=8262 RepID=A0A9N7V132_PLEPL|nr:unnamed protein product [Pleuronectes platessa]
MKIGNTDKNERISDTYDSARPSQRSVERNRIVLKHHNTSRKSLIPSVFLPLRGSRRLLPSKNEREEGRSSRQPRPPLADKRRILSPSAHLSLLQPAEGRTGCQILARRSPVSLREEAFVPARGELGLTHLGITQDKAVSRME